MGWTPPSKFIVVITFLLMAFGIAIFMDINMGLWPSFLAGFAFNIGTYDGWVIIGLILVFLTWFLFFLGVKLTGI